MAVIRLPYCFSIDPRLRPRATRPVTTRASCKGGSAPSGVDALAGEHGGARVLGERVSGVFRLIPGEPERTLIDSV